MNGVRLLFAIASPRPKGLPGINAWAIEVMRTPLVVSTASSTSSRDADHSNKSTTQNSETNYRLRSYFGASLKPLPRWGVSLS